MNPPKPTPLRAPAFPAADADTVPASWPDIAPAHAATRPAQPGVPLGLAAVLAASGAALLAGATAYGAVLLLDNPAAWTAALAAAAGVLVAGLPLGLLVLKLARTLPAASAGDDAAGAQQAPGISRALFIDLAEREVARARRYGSGAALLLVDIDRHARLCEARGVAAGAAVLDGLLRQTAPMLRTADVLTQFSDTQMAVFLAHADATGALDVAERIRERTEQLEVPFAPPGQPAAQAQRLRMTVSVGVAHLRPAHLNLRALVDDADDAAVAARQAGGNCVRAAPVDAQRTRPTGTWRDERRAKPKPGRPS